VNANYLGTSVVVNMGPFLCIMIVLMKILGVLRLCFPSRRYSFCKYMTIHTVINFELSSQIVQLTSALLYLRFSKDSLQDWFFAVTGLISTAILFIGILMTAHIKGWWRLHIKLHEKRASYPKKHQELMDNPSREKLNNLEKSTHFSESRFNELQRTFGHHNLYPSIIGFDRAILYLLFKVTKALPFAIILVFVDV